MAQHRPKSRNSKYTPIPLSLSLTVCRVLAKPTQLTISTKSITHRNTTMASKTLASEGFVYQNKKCIISISLTTPNRSKRSPPKASYTPLASLLSASTCQKVLSLCIYMCVCVKIIYLVAGKMR